MINKILFLFLISLSSVNAAPKLVILINGLSCSGKSTFVKNLIKNFGENFFSIVEMDKIKTVQSSFGDEQENKTKLHNLVCEKISKSIEENNDYVICDVVIDGKISWNIYSNFFNKNNIKVLKIFISCPILDLMERLQTRNNIACKFNATSAEKKEKRIVSDVLLSFAKMFSCSDIDFGYGEINTDIFDKIFKCTAMKFLKSQDIIMLKKILSRSEIFDFSKKKQFYLKPFFIDIPDNYDIVINNINSPETHIETVLKKIKNLNN